MKVVSDYGGNAWEKGRATVTPLSSTVVYVCIKCNRRRHLTIAQLERAATPTCVRCGGLLVKFKKEEQPVVEDLTPTSKPALKRWRHWQEFFEIKYQPLRTHLHLLADAQVVDTHGIVITTTRNDEIGFGWSLRLKKSLWPFLEAVLSGKGFDPGEMSPPEAAEIAEVADAILKQLARYALDAPSGSK